MQDIHNHDHANALMEDYVMGTLSEADLAWMDAHIATCAVCEREIPVLLEGAYALAWSPDDPPSEMPDDIWTRIEQSLQPAPDATLTWPTGPATGVRQSDD